MLDDALDPDVERMLRTPSAHDLGSIRERIREETAARRAALEGCGDTLYALCFLLYLVGEAEDARLIHEARTANMDCRATIDAALSSMRRTPAELRAVLDPVRDAGLLSELESVSSQPEELEELESDLRSYFELD